MYYLYRITNKISGTIYDGITNDVYQRMAVHKYSAFKRTTKSPLYCAMRAYGYEAFEVTVLQEFSSREEASQAEIASIARNKELGQKSYNLHPGGSGGFSILTKSPEEIEEWRARQRQARSGKTPALGMKHTDENKKLFGDYGRYRWDLYGRYDVEAILAQSFIEANKQFGISKTHYYRLRKQHRSNESM